MLGKTYNKSIVTFMKSFSWFSCSLSAFLISVLVGFYCFSLILALKSLKYVSLYFSIDRQNLVISSFCFFSFCSRMRRSFRGVCFEQNTKWVTFSRFRTSKVSPARRAHSGWKAAEHLPFAHWMQQPFSKIKINLKKMNSNGIFFALLFCLQIKQVKWNLFLSMLSMPFTRFNEDRSSK